MNGTLWVAVILTIIGIFDFVVSRRIGNQKKRAYFQILLWSLTTVSFLGVWLKG
ncbi:hypothetical protein QE429_000914 [Bacillus sp. SORGH_AS 510]|nr:hypothetical protein [Bacillus sp. SORGH_AS_0510]